MFPVMWQWVCIFQGKGEIHKVVAVPRKEGKKKKKKEEKLHKCEQQILSMRKKINITYSWPQSALIYGVKMGHTQAILYNHNTENHTHI